MNQVASTADIAREASAAMSVDVEEYFHASALADAFPRSTWKNLESRVDYTTREILDLFARNHVKATFFTLGSVARAQPLLIKDIAAAGHELASHGNEHHRVSDQTPQEFRADVLAAKHAIEDASGSEVRGYRAASFSIDRRTWWAYQVLAESGYRYSSSVYPIRHDHYGLVGGPTQPFAPISGDFTEIPITTARIAGRLLPAGGGGYFRLMPQWAFRYLQNRATSTPPHLSNFYFHPWEMDPDQPRANTNARSKFRHYVNLGLMKSKIETLAKNRSWSSLCDVYEDYLVSRVDLPFWSPAITTTSA